jgi:hypothetical protein
MPKNDFSFLLDGDKKPLPHTSSRANKWLHVSSLRMRSSRQDNLEASNHKLRYKKKNTTTTQQPRKQAGTLVFEVGGWFPSQPPPTTLENKHACSLLRLVVAFPTTTLKNEHMCSFLRLVVVFPSTTLKNEHVCSFLRLVVVFPSTTLKNEHVCSFLC